MTHSTRRRLTARLLVGTALAIPALATLSVPAQTALADNCSALVSTLEFTGTHVVAEKYRLCTSGDIKELSTGIQQRNPVTGGFVTVATGVGVASYRCNGGSPAKRYRMTGTSTAGVLYACA